MYSDRHFVSKGSNFFGPPVLFAVSCRRFCFVIFWYANDCYDARNMQTNRWRHPTTSSHFFFFFFTPASAPFPLKPWAAYLHPVVSFAWIGHKEDNFSFWESFLLLLVCFQLFSFILHLGAFWSSFQLCHVAVILIFFLRHLPGLHTKSTTPFSPAPTCKNTKIRNKTAM